MSTANQAYVFLATVYAGLMIGLMYDLYRMIRRIIKPGNWLTAILDLLFWLVVAVFSFFVLFIANDGEVRFYHFIGFASGWALYILALSQWVMALLTLVYRFLCKFFAVLFHLLTWPFKMIWKGIKVPVRFIHIAFGKLCKKLKGSPAHE